MLLRCLKKMFGWVMRCTQINALNCLCGSNFTFYVFFFVGWGKDGRWCICNLASSKGGIIKSQLFLETCGLQMLIMIINHSIFVWLILINHSWQWGTRAHLYVAEVQCFLFRDYSYWKMWSYNWCSCLLTYSFLLTARWSTFINIE